MWILVCLLLLLLPKVLFLYPPLSGEDPVVSGRVSRCHGILPILPPPAKPKSTIKESDAAEIELAWKGKPIQNCNVFGRWS